MKTTIKLVPQENDSIWIVSYGLYDEVGVIRRRGFRKHNWDGVIAFVDLINGFNGLMMKEYPTNRDASHFQRLYDRYLEAAK